jgi:hypothetical protein
MKITVGKVPGPSAAAGWTPEETIEKALLRPVTLDVVRTPLDEVAEQLARQLDVNLTIDEKALKDIGLCPPTPVTYKVTNLALHFALDELLHPLDLVWTVRNGVLLVTTPQEAETVMMTEVYDVSALLVNCPDYPAGRSNDLGDPEPLFVPTPERHYYELMRGMGGSMNMGMGNGPALASLVWDVDTLMDSIRSVIEPTLWSDVGGPCSIFACRPQQVVVVSAPRHVQEELAAYLDTLRHRIETRPQIRIEAHWLWLTEKELASLLGDQDKGSSSAGDVVEEAAWKKLLQEKQKSRDEGYEPAVAFQAILKGQNGQLISGVSGRQTRVMVTLIPVVGDRPAAGAGGLMPPVPAPASPQTPAPPLQTPALPAPAPTYPPHFSAVGYQPECRTIQEGGALEVRPCVVAEGKEILLDLHSRFVQREDHPTAQPQTPASGVAAGANGPSANVVQAVAAAVDRPRIYHYRLESTLRVPTGRRVLVGGLADVEGGSSETNLCLFVKATVPAM